VSGGIYFVPESAPQTLSFYDFSTERIRVLGDLARVVGMGFAFSPDRRSLLVAPTEFRNGDLFCAVAQAQNGVSAPRKRNITCNFSRQFTPTPTLSISRLLDKNWSIVSVVG
jgi:hypothetical protein